MRVPNAICLVLLLGVWCSSSPGVVRAQGGMNAATISYNGDAIVFDADITVAGYSHKLMEAVDVLVNANYTESISNAQTTINHLETSVGAVGGELDAFVANTNAQVASMATTVQTQLASVNPNNSPLPHNCTVGAVCPCFPVSPCDQGLFCMAQGPIAYTCGQRGAFAPSVPFFSTEGMTFFEKTSLFLSDALDGEYIGNPTYQYFGRFAEFNFDGTELLISSNQGRDTITSVDGSLFYFARPSPTSTNWTLLQHMAHPVADPADTSRYNRNAMFGSGFAVSADRSVLVARNYPDIAIMQRNTDTGLYEMIQQVFGDGTTSSYPYYYSVSADGNVFAAGVVCRYFEVDTTTYTRVGQVVIWQRLAPKLPFQRVQTILRPGTHPVSSGVYFGHHTKMTEDSLGLVIGTEHNSADPAEVYVYARNDSASPFVHIQTIMPTLVSGADAERVYAMDMTPSGDALVMGSYTEGAHWTYVRASNGTFVLAHRVEIPDIKYGFSVSINFEHLVVVGAPEYSSPCLNAGLTYFYARANETSWFLQQEVGIEEVATCTTQKMWGKQLTVSQDFKTLMVGNPFYDVYATDDYRGINQILQRV